MTKDKALYAYFSEFGLPAYVSTSVPDNAPFPRLTYDPVFTAFDFSGANAGEVACAVNLWYRTESEAIPNEKAFEISEAIGQGGNVIPCDDGYIWIKRGSPFAQPMTDPNDTMVKRRYLNITLEYFTTN